MACAPSSMTSICVLMPAFASACFVSATASGSSSTMRIGLVRGVVTGNCSRAGFGTRRMAVYQFFHDIPEFPPAKPGQHVIDARGPGGMLEIFHRGPHHDRHVQIQLADLPDEREAVHPRHA